MLETVGRHFANRADNGPEIHKRKDVLIDINPRRDLHELQALRTESKNRPLRDV
jgi:hypothetical protein